jgi:hypothetical protein
LLAAEKFSFSGLEKDRKMSLIPKDGTKSDLFKEMKAEDKKAVCGQCGYMDCVCTSEEEY